MIFSISSLSLRWIEEPDFARTAGRILPRFYRHHGSRSSPGRHAGRAIAATECAGQCPTITATNSSCIFVAILGGFRARPAVLGASRRSVVSRELAAYGVPQKVQSDPAHRHARVFTSQEVHGSIAPLACQKESVIRVRLIRNIRGHLALPICVKSAPLASFGLVRYHIIRATSYNRDLFRRFACHRLAKV